MSKLPVQQEVARQGDALVVQDLVDGDGNAIALRSEVTAVDDKVAQGDTVALDNTADGVTTLLAAAAFDRIVTGHVLVDEVFADGTGTQTTFEIGETGAAAKFMGTAELTGAAAGTRVPFAGKLLANKALIITAVAATGTGTGGITATASASVSAT